MNLLTIIILLVLLVFAINGYMRGFARTLTSLLFFVFSGVLVYYSTPYVNDFLKTQTPVYSFVESKCETLVEDAIMDKLDEETQKFAQQSDVPRKDQNKIIKSLPIPKELQTQLLDNNNSYTYANMAVLTPSLLHNSEPTRRGPISCAGFCFKKKNKRGGERLSRLHI